MLRYLSVCSGIEAATVAWHPFGWEPVGFCEIEPFPSAVLAHHFPGVPNYGDFTQIARDPAHPVRRQRVDLLVGGTPCQDFSVAGLRAGLDGKRGQLTLEFFRLAAVLNPEWIVWENVPGVLSQDGGRAFGAVLGALDELGFGWAYRVLDAQCVRVDGYPRAVPQRRRRVFVVGCRGGDRERAERVLLEPEGVFGHSPPRRKAGTGASRAASGGAGGDGERGEAFGGGNTSGPLDVATARNAHSSTVRIDFDSETFMIQAYMPARSLAKDGGVNEHFAPRDVCDALHTSSGNSGNKAPLLAEAYQQHGSNVGPMGTLRRGNGNEQGGVPFMVDDGVAHTIRAEGHDASEVGPWRGPPLTVGGHGRVRRLTPLECEKLMGFPPGWTLIPTTKRSHRDPEMIAYLRRQRPNLTDAEIAKLAADGPRYKAIGNSMAVNVMRWIGAQIVLNSFHDTSHAEDGFRVS